MATRGRASERFTGGLMKRWFGLLLAASLVASLPMAAWAEPPRPPARPAPSQAVDPVPVPAEVGVRVLVVRATNAHSRVDPELENMAERLRTLSYRGFTLID